MDINPCSVDDAAAPRASRITHLDGLRGWFCIQVMLSHIAFPWPQELNVFSEGVFGVMVFFALSGFALSAINQPQQMVRFALGRYLRLALPCAAVSIFYSVAQLQPPAKVFVRLLKDTVFGFLPPMYPPEYAGHSFDFLDRSKDLMHLTVLPMWTMRYEMVGSFLVLGLTTLSTFVSGPRRYALWLIIYILFVVTNIFFSFFVIGVAFHELHTSWAPVWRCHSVASWIALAASACLYYTEQEHMWSLAWYGVTTVRIMCLFYAVHVSDKVKTFLNMQVSQALGSLSLAAYILHDPIRRLLGGVAEKVTVGIIVLVIIFPASWVFARTVDAWSVRRARGFARYFMDAQAELTYVA